MKVLQINSVCGVGSTGRIATDIHAILKEQGHESYIAYGRGTPTNCDTTIRIGDKLDNYAHVAKTRVFDKHGFGSKRATKEFISKVKELDPDVIHLHNIHGYYINIEVLFDYLKTAGKPVIWTLHDCWAFTGHCTHFDYANCDRWKTGCFKCPEKNSYPKSIFADNSRLNYEKKKRIFTGVKDLQLISPSRWLAKQVSQSFLKQYPIQIINNGVDINEFKPVKSEFRKKHNLENKFIILGVANIWSERKGLRYFFELSNKISNDEMIVLVGLSKKQKESLPKNILGLTKTNEIRKLAEIYSTADIYVNPTLEDNFPTTNLESMACGTPIITFNTGGSVESILDNMGIIVEKGNIDNLILSYKKIKRKKSINYLEQCRKTVVSYFNKDNQIKDYLNIYDQCLGVR